MPRYDYEPTDKDGKCDYCGGRFEVVQSMKEEPLKECPMCDRPVRRIISAPAVRVPRSNTELRDVGFTKLKKTADGTYENLTRRPGESPIFDPKKFKLPPGAD